MGIRYKAEERNGYLLVRTEGTTSEPEDLIGLVDALVREISARNVDKLMLDNRGLLFERKHIGTFDTAVQCVDKVEKVRTVKVAMLVRPERVEYAKVYETIGLTSNMQIKVFKKKEMAVAWLTA